MSPLSPQPQAAPATHTSLWIACLIFVGSVAASGETETQTDSEREFFHQRFHCAKEAFQRDPSSPKAAMRYARAAFEWADQPMEASERAQIATPAIKVCRQFLNSTTHKGEAHYYLALNLGQLAKTKWLGALKIVNEMEKRLLTAIAVTPELDYGGPDRALCHLYHRAPRWPTSIGNRNLAIKHAQNAITVAPDYPGNRLMHLEVLLAKGKEKHARKQLAPTEDVLTKARSRLNTTYWKYSWKTWDQTWISLRARIAPSP